MTSTIDTSGPILLTPSTPHIDTILSGMAHVHAQCVIHDGTLLSYMPPLSHAKLFAFWRTRVETVTQNARHLIVSTQPVSSRSSPVQELPLFAADSDHSPPTPKFSIAGVDYEVSGFVALAKPNAETGPFRGVVEKLAVSPNHRQKGLARDMMRELERMARLDGRWSLLLDTTVGTPAEKVYPRLGYIRMGVVEAYGLNPKTGEYVDEVWFWKDLRKSAPL